MMLNRQSRRQFLGNGVGACGLAILADRFGSFAAGAEDVRQAGELTQNAVEFLKPRQDVGGAWSANRNEPGITALVVTALLRSGRVAPGEPAVTKALGFLEQFVGDQGGLSEASHANYATAVALMAFHEANARTGGRYDAFIKGGQNFLKRKQWDEAEGKDRGDAYYGGAGYGGKNDRPDLSNTSFMIEALRDTGLPADDPALQKALIFVSRCQNLKSEFNDQPWADKINDGGFIYTPAKGGQSFAGSTDDGGLRSYAGMTYAGLKSMIYAGLSKDDPRVKAARDYIARNYTLDENPGLGQMGLYYYYQVFAKAMSLLGEPKFTDASGKVHDWRADVTNALAKRQNDNGSWVNPTDRFMEGDPNLVTAYGLLTLAYARPA